MTAHVTQPELDCSTYVYIHWDKEEPVYVGIGSTYRAWRSCNRKPGHRDWMNCQLPELNVEIVASHVQWDEARMLEYKLIKALRPKFNIKGK